MNVHYKLKELSNNINVIFLKAMPISGVCMALAGWPLFKYRVT